MSRHQFVVESRDRQIREIFRNPSIHFVGGRIFGFIQVILTIKQQFGLLILETGERFCVTLSVLSKFSVGIAYLLSKYYQMLHIILLD